MHTPRLHPMRDQPVREQIQAHSPPTSHKGSAGQGTNGTNPRTLPAYVQEESASQGTNGTNPRALHVYVPQGVSQLWNKSMHTPVMSHEGSAHYLRPTKGQLVREQMEQIHALSPPMSHEGSAGQGTNPHTLTA